MVTDKQVFVVDLFKQELDLSMSIPCPSRTPVEEHSWDWNSQGTAATCRKCDSTRVINRETHVLTADNGQHSFKIMDNIPEPIRGKLASVGYTSIDQLPNDKDMGRWNAVRTDCGLTIPERDKLMNIRFPQEAHALTANNGQYSFKIMDNIPEPIRGKLSSRGYSSLDELPNGKNTVLWDRVQNRCGLTDSELDRLMKIRFPQDVRQFIDVTALLATHSFSGTFENCLRRELPFRIPIWENKANGNFVYADSVYGPCLDSWIMHVLPSSTSEMSVRGMDGNWLSAVKLLVETSVIYVNQHHASSEAKLRPDGVITVNGALAGIIESKALEDEMITAASEIPSKLNPTAYKAFPLNQVSIPGFASCSTCVTLHSVAYDHATKRFTQVQLKKYEMSIMGHRLLFLVDLFKILTWMMTLQSSQQLEHLVPGVKRQTANGHFVTWMHAGLLKQFSREGIRLDLIDRAYSANLQHVERGRVNGRSVTITSIGKTLHNAIRMRVVVSADSVIAQLHLGVAELHGLGIAHCDICTDNMFVLDDGTVILGDLEYCTEIASPPPQVRRLYGNPSSALELDQQQVLRCIEDIRVMMSA